MWLPTVDKQIYIYIYVCVWVCVCVVWTRYTAGTIQYIQYVIGIQCNKLQPQHNNSIELRRHT